MSSKNAAEWLLGQNAFTTKEINRNKQKAVTIAVASGKGGVGKSSLSLKMAKILSSQDRKVLLIDCDHNLSNIVVKLGLPLNSSFYNFINSNNSYKDYLHKDGNFHLLSGCNGDIGMFESSEGMDKIILDVIMQAERDYDYIILDSAAGIDKCAMTLCAYVDYRFVIVTPDRSSLTDSYSLMKLLKKKYGVSDNHLIVNKVTQDSQYRRIIKSLSETVENFLKCRLSIFGQVPYIGRSSEKFDELLIGEENSALHKNLLKALERFTEESCGDCLPGLANIVPREAEARNKMFLQP